MPFCFRPAMEDGSMAFDCAVPFHQFFTPDTGFCSSQHSDLAWNSSSSPVCSSKSAKSPRESPASREPLDLSSALTCHLLFGRGFCFSSSGSSSLNITALSGRHISIQTLLFLDTPKAHHLHRSNRSGFPFIVITWC